MRKLISLIVCGLLSMMLLCACGDAKEEYLNVGDTAQTDDAEIILKSVNFLNSYSFVGSVDGYKFVEVNFSLKNIGKKDFHFIKHDSGSSKHVYVIPYVDYNDGYTFNVSGDISNGKGGHYDETCFIKGDFDYIDEVKPLGDEANFVVAIAVPEEVVTNESAPLIVRMRFPTSGDEQKECAYKIR